MKPFRLPSWLSELVARYKKSVAIALTLGLLASGCAALLMFTAGYLISATAEPAITLFSIMVPIAFVQIFGLGRPAARYLERLISHDWVLRITSDLRVMLFRGIEGRLGDPTHEKATGEYLGLLSDDISHLQNLYLRVVFPTAIAYLLAIGASILFGCFSPLFALVVLAIFVLCAGIIPLGALVLTRKLNERIKRERASEYAGLTDDVLGAVDWILAGRAESVLQKHASCDSSIRASEMRIRMIQRALSLVAALVLGVTACIVLVWAGSTFGSADGTTRWIAAFALGFFPLIETLSALPGVLPQATTHEDAIIRLGEYASTQEAEASVSGDAHSAENAVGVIAAGTVGVASAEDFASAVKAGAAEAFETRNCADVQEDAYSVVVDSVSYTYPGARARTLDAISLNIERGQSVAVLGRSGSGKSTLARCILGVLEPDSGFVLVDGAPVVYDAITMASKVAYLGQKPYLFNRTLRENLTLGSDELDDKTLEYLLGTVGLGQKFATLEKGLDTLVGETGIGFSGGEAHRIALARVLVTDAPVVLVDEPFSALDRETERDLLTALLDACANRTLIVITHHLAEIERFDRVIFIENGAVDLDGSPEQLKAQSPRFCKLLAFDRA